LLSRGLDPGGGEADEYAASQERAELGRRTRGAGQSSTIPDIVVPNHAAGLAWLAAWGPIGSPRTSSGPPAVPGIGESNAFGFRGLSRESLLLA
jgi:hypothetical protein